MDIKTRFNSILEKNPSYSTYTAFAMAVSGMRISGVGLVKLFDELVDKDDYDEKDRKDIILHLRSLRK